MAAKIWAVGAGKGGVGKTFLSASIAITLSKLEFSTLVIDLDSSGANIHTNLGINPSENTICSFFNGKSPLINLIQPTNIPRLSFIQGVWDEWATYELSVRKVTELVQELKKLPYDFIVIDLGPGAMLPNLEIMRLADEKILLTTPEPTCLEKSYRFLEAYLVNELAPAATLAAIENLKNSLKQFRQKNKGGFFSFREYLSKEAGYSPDFFDTLNSKPIRLVLNCSRSSLDQQLGHSIKSVCNKYYDLKIDYLGSLDYDNAVWQSIRNREPFLIDKPFTPLSGQILSICKTLSSAEMNANNIRAVL